MYANGSIIDLEVPYEKDRNDIIRKHHDQVGHPGINATVDSIQQQYTYMERLIYRDQRLCEQHYSIKFILTNIFVLCQKFRNCIMNIFVIIESLRNSYVTLRIRSV